MASTTAHRFVPRFVPRLVTAGALTGVLGLTSCGAPPAPTVPNSPEPGVMTSGPTTTTAPPTPESPRCTTAAADLTAEQQAGQLLMVGIDSRSLPGSQTMTLLSEHQVGNLLLLQNSTAGVDSTRRMTDQLRSDLTGPAGIGLSISVDQEGGMVQRLQGPGFEKIPSASEQAKLAPEELEAEATQWAEQLKAAGVDINLAPVADVVPPDMASRNDPIAQLDRGYGSDRDQVSESVRRFITGHRTAAVAAAAKHYPGLGKVTGNTDFADSVVDDRTTRDDPDLATFRAATEAGAGLLMISSATYTQIDPDNEAVFSPVIMEMARADLGFDGVLVSDDVGVAENVATVPAGERALRFVWAGGDLVITADPATVAPMTSALVEAMASDPALAERVAESTARVLALKEDLGHATC